MLCDYTMINPSFVVKFTTWNSSASDMCAYLKKRLDQDIKENFHWSSKLELKILGAFIKS